MLGSEIEHIRDEKNSELTDLIGPYLGPVLTGKLSERVMLPGRFIVGYSFKDRICIRPE